MRDERMRAERNNGRDGKKNKGVAHLVLKEWITRKLPRSARAKG